VKPADDEETREQRRPGSGSGSRLRVVLRCTYCKDAVGQREAVFCSLCLAPHHDDCRRAHGRCAAPGCTCPATVRPRSTSERRRAVRPRIPAGPRAALVSLPALLGIVAASAGLAGSATALALTVRSSSGTQVVIAPPAPGAARLDGLVVPPAPASEAPGAPPTWSARVRLEANGFVQTVDLTAREQLHVGLAGEATNAWVAREDGRMEVVLSLLPAGPVRVGLATERRELDVSVEAEEAAVFELLWGWSWPEGYRPDEPRPGAPAVVLGRIR
jgi:hypothetical protein